MCCSCQSSTLFYQYWYDKAGHLKIRESLICNYRNADSSTTSCLLRLSTCSNTGQAETPANQYIPGAAHNSRFRFQESIDQALLLNRQWFFKPCNPRILHGSRVNYSPDLLQDLHGMLDNPILSEYAGQSAGKGCHSQQCTESFLWATTPIESPMPEACRMGARLMQSPIKHLPRGALVKATMTFAPYWCHPNSSTQQMNMANAD